MKTIIFTTLLCLLACGTAFGLQHQKSQARSLLQSRHHEDNCNLTCTGDITTTITPTTNWQIDIEATISIYYEANFNFFIIYHKSLNIILAIDGKSGLVGLFNISTGGSLVINIKTGFAVYIHAQASIKALLTANITVEIIVEACSKIISDNKPGSVSTGNTFNLTELIITVKKEGSISAIFKGRADLEANFKASFNIIIKTIANADITVTQNVIFSVFIFMFDHDTSITAILRICDSLDATFNYKVFVQIYISITKSTTSLINLQLTIQAVGYIYANIDVALEAYINGNGVSYFRYKLVVYGGVTYELRYALTVDGSWFISLSKDGKLYISLVYVKSVNIFAVFNFDLNMVFVYSGSNGLFGIWCLKTGEGILIKYSGLAIVLKADANIVEQYKNGNTLQIVVLIAATIKANASFSMITSGSFQFILFISTVQTAGLKAAAVVGGSSYGVLSGTFGAFFGLVANASFKGQFTILFVITGQIQGFSNSVTEFCVSIFIGGLRGMANSELFLSFWTVFQVNIEVDVQATFSGSFWTKLSSVTKGLTSLSGITAKLEGALGSSFHIGFSSGRK